MSDAERQMDAVGLEQKNGRPLVWVVRVERANQMDMVNVAASRGAARKRAEQICSDVLDDPIQNWMEDWDEGNSELGVREMSRSAIIARRYLDRVEDFQND